MSGAGSIKLDGSDDEYMYEVKDANLSYTLKSKDVETAFKQAAREGKECKWLITFKGFPGYTVELTVVPDG